MSIKAVEDSSKSKEDKKPEKEQTIIVTETKSLAQAINEAVKKPDGKPTLVIIETKTPVTNNSGSNGMVSPSSTGTSASPQKSRAALGKSPGQTSLRAALMQGTGMTTRSQTRPPTMTNASTSGNANKGSASSSKSDAQGVALQDDAEVNVYTPSLLVPYLFECPAKESLSDFVKKIAPPDTTPPKPEVKVDEEDEYEPPLPKAPLKQKTFFDTALGQFYVDIGLVQVQQWVQSEILKAQKKKLDRGWKTKEREKMVASLQKNLGEIKLKAGIYNFAVKKCKRCDFVTESQTVLDRHLETIHVNGNKMLCSFCEFESADPSQIFHHLYTAHKAFGRLERPPTTHMCPICPFEDAGKARVTRHMWKCIKTFVPDKNLAPSPDFEPPAKRTRHLASVATLKALRAGPEKESGSNNSGSGYSQHHGMNAGTSLLASQSRGAHHPIRPKPGDVRLTPTYVQSVLRGAYGSNSTSIRAVGPISQSSLPYGRSGSTVGKSLSNAGTYLVPRNQAASINPLPTSASYSLQGNQLYQVVHSGSASNLVPLVRGSPVNTFTPPRFTILPTQPATINTRGPTPVALIPNLATTSKPGTVSGGGSSANLRPSTMATPVVIGAQSSSSRNISSKPNISITPVNKPVQSPRSATLSALNVSKGPSPSQLNRPSQQQPSGQQGNSSYVVCEICDGYIKDLDQLRNHMQWIHKVKIHPKMIHNRPPLNCQKCHFRFFTDQGLERHLLGYHGLVTSSMQENANKGKDGGRCIICGKVFLWKLVVHMAKDHKMTLKPAHLSYKCTVCSATFNMYRLFETHVYEEHSTVAKRVLDGQKNYSGNQTSITVTTASTTSNQTSITVRRTDKSSPSILTKSTAVSAVAKSPVTKSASTASQSSTTASSSKPPPGAIQFPVNRTCVDCGTDYKRTSCIRHWEKTNQRPCHIKLCRIDKCEKCIDKEDDAQNGQSPEITVVKSTIEPKKSVVVEKKPAVVEKKPAVVEKKPAVVEKKPAVPEDKLEDEPPPAKKVKIEVEYSPQKDKGHEEPSDGDDVFDMEVETVDDDDDQQSPINTDVESD